jgi:hypothetical protein
MYRIVCLGQQADFLAPSYEAPAIPSIVSQNRQSIACPGTELPKLGLAVECKECPSWTPTLLAMLALVATVTLVIGEGVVCALSRPSRG